MNKDVVLEAAQKVQFFNMSYKLLDVACEGFLLLL